jgi:hypothetical protein
VNRNPRNEWPPPSHKSRANTSAFLRAEFEQLLPQVVPIRFPTIKLCPALVRLSLQPAFMVTDDLNSGCLPLDFERQAARTDAVLRQSPLTGPLLLAASAVALATAGLMSQTVPLVVIALVLAGLACFAWLRSQG